MVELERKRHPWLLPYLSSVVASFVAAMRAFGRQALQSSEVVGDGVVQMLPCARRVACGEYHGPNSTGGKLGLYLSKLHLRVRLAEWWPFEADRRNSDGLRCLCHSWGG